MLHRNILQDHIQPFFLLYPLTRKPAKYDLNDPVTASRSSCSTSSANAEGGDHISSRLRTTADPNETQLKFQRR